jgi:hypothetical protein
MMLSFENPSVDTTVCCECLSVCLWKLLHDCAFSHKRSFCSVSNITCVRSVTREASVQSATSLVWLSSLPNVFSKCWVSLRAVLRYRNIKIVRNNVFTDILRSNVGIFTGNKSNYVLKSIPLERQTLLHITCL